VKLELSASTQGKMDDLMDHLITRYGMEELPREDLIEALLDIGLDVILGEEMTMLPARDRFLAYCAEKVRAEN